MNASHGPMTIRAERYSVLSKRSADDDDDGRTKIIHFQRHGQGYHNLIYRILDESGRPVQDVYDPDPAVNPFVRPEIVDSPLTEHGRAQCASQRSKASSLQPELLIVSPLHRAIQTAQITFEDFRGKVPFVAHEACREELGLLVCNKRRPLSETIREFPDVDFSLVTSGEEDTLWSPEERECPVDKSKRIYSFLVDYVRHLPQKEIGVVGHSAWMFNMCNAVMDCGGDDELTSWFGTSEIRSMKVIFSD
jgi:broad specificity phosphatase PhoE